MLEEDYRIREDFIGNRDFFFLIKGIANELNNNINNYDISFILRKYIRRNFGGFEILIDFESDFTSIEELEIYKKDPLYHKFFEELKEEKKLSFIQIFEKIFNLYCQENELTEFNLDDDNYPEDFNYIQNIIDNIKDKDSRYLLIGIRVSFASLIHQKLQKELNNKTIYFYEGSPFDNDKNNKEYQFKIINNILENAERGDTIILNNLKQIYPYLYDLFNKNFIIKDGRQYTRICLGNYYDQLSYVNKEFKIIIFDNKKTMNKAEPPFLNRFEKIILSLSQLIKLKQKNLAEIIYNEIDLEKVGINYKHNYKLKNLLIGCHKEDILGMIYNEINSSEQAKYKNKIQENENDNDIEYIKKNIFNKIYKLLPQDIIINLNDSNKLREL